MLTLSRYTQPPNVPTSRPQQHLSERIILADSAALEWHRLTSTPTQGYTQIWRAFVRRKRKTCVSQRLSARLVTLFRHQAAAVKDGTALAVLEALVRVKLRRQSEGELATRRQARARARARARGQARARARVGRRCAGGER